jgi:hypothetical protein
MEFEKNKNEILGIMKTTNPNLAKINNTSNEIFQESENRKYAWQYEIEEYRKKKNLERFYKIGALAGIISLIITIADKLMPFEKLRYTLISHILK